jgi:hypothetical protein
MPAVQKEQGNSETALAKEGITVQYGANLF